MTNDPNNPPVNDPNIPNNPIYQPPMANSYVQIKPFESGHTRALFVMIFLAAGILLNVVSIFSDFMQISMLSAVAAGRTISAEEADVNDSRQALIAIVQVLGYIVTAIGFLIWIHRAHRNLPALGAKNLEFTPGWAVGGFFVPFLNLFRPYKVMVEIWKASSPEFGVSDDISWEYAASSPLLGFWWGFWIISNILGRLVGKLSVGAKSADDFLSVTWLSIASNIVSMLAAVLAITVVWLIDKRQEEKHRLLLAANTQQWGAPPPQWGPPPPPPQQWGPPQQQG
jgi:hypothetical protein